MEQVATFQQSGGPVSEKREVEVMGRQWWSLPQPGPGWLCDPMDCSTPGFHVFHHLLELAQTLVHWVSNLYYIQLLNMPDNPAGLVQWHINSRVALLFSLCLWPFSSLISRPWFRDNMSKSGAFLDTEGYYTKLMYGIWLLSPFR